MAPCADEARRARLARLCIPPMTLAARITETAIAPNRLFILSSCVERGSPLILPEPNITQAARSCRKQRADKKHYAIFLSPGNGVNAPQSRQVLMKHQVGRRDEIPDRSISNGAKTINRHPGL